MRTLQRATPTQVLDHRFEIEVRFVPPRAERGQIAGVLVQIWRTAAFTRSETLRAVCAAFARRASWRPGSK